MLRKLIPAINNPFRKVVMSDVKLGSVTDDPTVMSSGVATVRSKKRCRLDTNEIVHDLVC
jgi:hypothetical protein